MAVPYLVAKNQPSPVPVTPSYAAISGLSSHGRSLISAAQLAKPQYYHNSFGAAFRAFDDRVHDTLEDAVQPGSPSQVSAPGSAWSAATLYSSPVTPAQLDYLNAEIASHYGMSRETAYQEALSNTAYQRGVKDMQAAGLNPAVIYGAGKGSPADGVYSVRSASSSGGSGGRSSGSSKNNGKLFSTGEFYGISAAAGLISAIASKNPNSYWIGQTVAQGMMTAANSFFAK